MRKKKADLYLLGMGIRGMDQISIETMQVLQDCRLVFHVSYSHDELTTLNDNVVDLDAEYWTDEAHAEVYERLVDRIMSEVVKGPGVASVTYGHPLFFDDVHMTLLRRCKRKGLNCVVLPAISSLDTLSVDLGIDYGEGLQILEAVDMLENEIPLNPDLHTLVFQIGEFGMTTTISEAPDDPERFLPIQEYLLRYFSPDHRFVVAFSDLGEGLTQVKSRIGKLNSRRRSIPLGSTLYIPPIR